jgi:Protein of unknown function (DUF2637)
MLDPAPSPTTPPPAPAASGVVFADPLLRRGLFTVVLAMATVVCAVAAAAFFLSFEAIRAFARHSGGIAPQHAWLAPLLVDSFIFVASAADLWFAATGTARTATGAWQHLVAALPKLLLGVAAGGSFALNVAHAPNHLGARAIAALPPAALVLTFEILLVIVRRAVAARVARLTAHAAVSVQPPGTLTPATVSATRPAPTTPPARPGASTGRRGQAAAARLAEVRRLYLDGVTVGEEIARRLDLPPSTTRRLLTVVKRDLATSQHPPGERLATDRPPEGDDRPPGRALVALTRSQGGGRP